MNPPNPTNTSSNSQNLGVAGGGGTLDSQSQYVPVRKCTQCGYYTAIFPSTVCNACKEKSKERQAASDLALYTERKTGKKCVRCGKQDAVEGKVLCQGCADLQTNRNFQQREQRMARYDQLKAEGKCTRCGKSEAVAGKSFCQECADKTNREVALRTARRKAAEEVEAANKTWE